MTGIRAVDRPLTWSVETEFQRDVHLANLIDGLARVERNAGKS